MQAQPQPIVQNDDCLQAFLACCHRRRYPKRTDIIKPGDSGDTLYYLIEGSVSISIQEDENRELILGYLNKGEFIGEIGVFLGERQREVTVRTREPCQLAEISYQRLEHCLRNELAPHAAELLRTLGRQVSRRLLQTSRKVGHLAFLDVTGRIARTLIDLCKEPDAMTHPDGMQIRITRQELGRIVGCSREMAGRVLKNLEEEGLLTAHGKTIVVYGVR
ncbi:CRP/FNR family transcriptional regulator, cyclic AMP receptor protein [Methylomarinovum tepidoasis]|uniref:CRP/FNR family transcriptional regulator, cyclic AMP receptor protein n=1 Tax=Methylomarinovum tepidoasis TaxID=2840183 RepID=A0AAU9C0U0_9GAMM|nr:cAMP-activated global transcriptional regulator CRP [Methylomarinovum sp. IN45]BCX89705.1 CRP/FNR family transcriptional regulator, cyclic AMP receptor protein [Methylomarinovum sp. IN45]